MELTERLKTSLAKVKKVIQEGRGSGTGAPSASGAGGGIVGGVPGNINMNLKDVKVPEFDVRAGRRSSPKGSGSGEAGLDRGSGEAVPGVCRLSRLVVVRASRRCSEGVAECTPDRPPQRCRRTVYQESCPREALVSALGDSRFGAFFVSRPWWAARGAGRREQSCLGLLARSRSIPLLWSFSPLACFASPAPPREERPSWVPTLARC